MKATIGIIGGSGLYSMKGFKTHEEVRLETAWGEPSDAYIVGKLDKTRIAFLARHGRGHRFSPSEINYRANIWGMKMLGVERILSLSAVGSLKEDLHPRDFLIPDQFIDRTMSRAATYFGDGLVAHVSFAEPVCPQLAALAADACRGARVTARRGGTYVCMEGPAFSTKAESNLYRSWGADVIGMTNLTEAKLAREAEICYLTIAMVTDYDCWRPEHDAVTVQDILGHLSANSAAAQRVIAKAILRMPPDRQCKCGSALSHALMTDRAAIPDAARRKLGLLVEKYLGEP